jgi:hemolysin-activating ACP:hemolysin acyltransferase
MFGNFGVLFLCLTSSDSDDLPGHATLNLLPQLEDHQPNVMFQQDGAPTLNIAWTSYMSRKNAHVEVV